jgi:hypothetical protein
MDHLLVPSNPILPPIGVPYICTIPYDNKGFFDYPVRRGWNYTRFTEGDFAEHPGPETLSFLQAWLYFGFLSEVLGRSVDSARFMRVSDDRQKIFVITSSPPASSSLLAGNTNANG